MEVLLRNQSLEQWLETALEQYRARFPSDYEAFVAHVSAENHFLVKPSGMSRDGHFMVKHFIPHRLHLYLLGLGRFELGVQDIWADPAVYKTLGKIAPLLKVRSKPTPFYDLVDSSQEPACPPSPST